MSDGQSANRTEAGPVNSGLDFMVLKNPLTDFVELEYIPVSSRGSHR